jgi:hypothetical protein
MKDGRIKMDLKDIGCVSVEIQIHLDQDRDQWLAPVTKVINLQVP